MFKRLTVFAKIVVVSSLLFVSAQYLAVSASTTLPKTDKCLAVPTQSATQSATQVATEVATQTPGATAVGTESADIETPEANSSDNGQANNIENCKTPKAAGASTKEVEMTEVAEPTQKPEPTHKPEATHKPEPTEKPEPTHKAEDKQGHNGDQGGHGESGSHG